MVDEIIVLPKEKHIAFAVQSLVMGSAEEHQIKIAMDWIINDLCGTYGMTFDPDNARMDAFKSGARHVGRTITNIANSNLSELYPEQQITETGSTKPLVIKRRRGK